MEELNPCPFCGTKPRLEHTTREIKESGNSNELRVYWQVKCGYCGCFRDGGFSEYIINNDGELKLHTRGYEKEPTDARKEAIEKWNERGGNRQ